MANYVLTNEAIRDLSNIWNYTFETWSERQADIYYSMLIKHFNLLPITHPWEKITTILALTYLD